MYNPLFFILVVFSLGSCAKDQGELIPDNNAPYYDKIPSVKIRNYVNRLFIDLIGREPLDLEMNEESFLLLQSNASLESRQTLINKLMFNETFREGDTTYNLAYFKRIYELNKIRLLEGVGNVDLSDQASIFRSAAITDSLSFNQAGYELNMAKYQELIDVLTSAYDLRDGTIDLQDQFARMILNGIYDQINMNSFNFVNACFDDLLFRFPSQQEFAAAYSMVEANESASLFEGSGQTKGEFVSLITSSRACREGIIVWTYVTLLARNPSSQELYNEMLLFGQNNNLQALQQRILTTNEYANF